MNPDALKLITCIAVDDEPMGLHVIQSHADKVPYLKMVGTFVSATEAMAYLQLQPIDLIFLDIQMPDLSGLEVAQLLGPQVHLIFTTAHPEYALDGFDLAATDYLLKPISLGRFTKACNRVAEKVFSPQHPHEQSLLATNYLFVKTGYEWTKIDLNNLLYIEADDNYLTFHETSKRTLSRMKLTEVLDMLPAGAFIRIHKSYIVAIAKIDTIERHQVILAGNQVPFSARFRQELFRHLNR